MHPRQERSGQSSEAAPNPPDAGRTAPGRPAQIRPATRWSQRIYAVIAAISSSFSPGTDGMSPKRQWWARTPSVTASRKATSAWWRGRYVAWTSGGPWSEPDAAGPWHPLQWASKSRAPRACSAGTGACAHEGSRRASPCGWASAPHPAAASAAAARIGRRSGRRAAPSRSRRYWQGTDGRRPAPACRLRNRPTPATGPPALRW